MNNVKIIYLISSLRKTGPVSILEQIVFYAKESGYDIEILTLSRSRREDEQVFKAKGCSVTCLDAPKGIAGALKAFFGLRKYLASQNEPCILHAHGIRPDFLLAITRTSPRQVKISTLHNVPILDYTFSYGRCAGRILAKIHLWSEGRLDRFVSVSSFAFSKNAAGRTNGVLIHNGVAASRFRVVPESSRMTLKRHLAWHEDALCCIISSNLTKGKNIDFLLRAFRRIEGNKFHLIVLGSGPAEQELKALCKDDNRIEFRGFQTDVVPYLQTADCYFSASKTEGLPCSVLESLLCGTKVFLSDIPPHAEILEKLPFAGHLFALDGDTDALKTLIESETPASESDRIKLSTDASAIFSSKVMAEKYLSLYANIINEKKLGD